MTYSEAADAFAGARERLQVAYRKYYLAGDDEVAVIKATIGLNEALIAFRADGERLVAAARIEAERHGRSGADYLRTFRDNAKGPAQ